MPLFLGTLLAAAAGSFDLILHSRNKLVRVEVPALPAACAEAAIDSSSLPGLVIYLLSQMSLSPGSRGLAAVAATWANAMTVARTRLLQSAETHLGSEDIELMSDADEWSRVWVGAFAKFLTTAPQQLSNLLLERAFSHFRCLVRELVRQCRATLLVDLLLCLCSSGSSEARRLLAPLCDEAHCLVSRLPFLADKIIPHCTTDFHSFLTSTFKIISASQPPTVSATQSKPLSVKSFDEMAAVLHGGSLLSLTLDDVKRHSRRVLMRSGPRAAQRELDALVQVEGCAEEIVALHKHYGILVTHFAS
jgi:hypothetical protein